MKRVRARLLIPGYLVLALVLTWPLAAHLGSSLPLGTEPVETVPLFNLWTLRWDQVQFGDLLRHFWDVPIFHPAPGAFALSEPQPLTGLVFAPIAAITGNAVLAYNVVLLAVLTLNAYGAYRLSRRFTGDERAAIAAGALGGALPFVVSQLGVLQLTVVFPLFLMAEAMVVWAATGRRRDAIAIGLWLAVTFLTCGYYGLFATLVMGAAGLVLIRRSWFSRDRVLDLASGAATFAVLGLPVAAIQAHLTAGYERSTATIEALSASREDFLRLPASALGTAWEPWLSKDATHMLYPGTVLLILAVVGFGVAHHRLSTIEADRRAQREGPDSSTGVLDPAFDVEINPEINPEIDAEIDALIDALIDRRRALDFLLIGAVLALLLAFGLHLTIGGFQPYEVVRHLVPGFTSLRNPLRFAVLTQVFLVPMAAMGLAVLAQAVGRLRLPRRALKAAATGAIVVATGLALIEVAITPVPLYDVDQQRPDWATWLADHSHGTEAGDGSVAFVPFPADGHVASSAETVRAMLALVDTDHPLVNGYSGLFPPSYDTLEEAMRTGPFPGAHTTGLLHDAGVSFVVATHDWLADHPDDALRPETGYTRVFEGRNADVYQLGR